MNKDVALFAAGTLLVCAGVIAPQTHVYNLNYLRPSVIGIAWNAGGIELSENGFAVFLCPAQYDYEKHTHWDNPLAPLFPEIVADC